MRELATQRLRKSGYCAAGENRGLFRRLLLLAFLFLLFGLGVGCRWSFDSPREMVRVVGSTALLPLAQDAAASWAPQDWRRKVQVFGGGSLVGLQLVAAARADVALSLIEPPAGDRRYQGLKGRVLGVMPLVLVAHPAVGVDSLTPEEAARIFLGEARNWREFGGSNTPIVIVNRGQSSGARQLVKKIILGGREFTGEARLANSDLEVRKKVSSTPGAIGYLSAAYLDNSVKTLKYDGVAYTSQTVAAGQYPLYGVARVYTRGDPEGRVRSFVEVMLQSSFLAAERKRGLLPLPTFKRPKEARSGVKEQ